MKRLFVFFALVLLATSAFADNIDRDVLLTAEGSVYTAELQKSDDSVGHVIAVTIQNGTFTARTIVPESLSSGVASAPALAYDTTSQTLFVFWLRMPNLMSSELLVSAYRDGKWEAPVSIDNQSFRLRSNLRIAVRRRVAELQSNGTFQDAATLVIHTVWWEQTTGGDLARYGLIAIDKGSVANVELHNLTDFLPAAAPAAVDATFNRELLKHPAIIDTASPDSVDVVFGDAKNNTLGRTTLRPIADGRIHIPIGHGGGGTRLGVPNSFTADWSGRVSAVMGGHDDGKFLLYNVSSTSVNFLMYSGATWSTVKTVPLNDKLSADSAIAALSRMLSQ